MGKQGIDAREMKMLLGLLAFALIWSIFLIPYLTTNAAFNSLNPVLQYIFVNLGTIFIVVVTFGTIFTLAKNKFSLVEMFKDGAAMWFSFSFAADMWQPPYAIDLLGNDLITDPATGINSAVDRVWVYIFNTITPGIKEFIVNIPVINYRFSMLFLAVYLVVPVITAILAAYVLSNGKFFNWFSFGGVNKSKRLSYE